MTDELGPTFAQWAGIELEQEPAFDPGTVTPGSLDRRVLEQAEVWVDRFGSVRRLVEMSDTYRANVVAHLHATCSWMWRRAAFEELLTAPIAVHAAQLDVGVPLIGDVDPHAWLESTPLVRELRRLTPNIADPGVLTAWAADMDKPATGAGSNRSTRSGHDVRMPQDPGRSWTADMRDAPVFVEDGETE